MKPKRFHAEGFCQQCQKPLDKLEVWVTPDYKTFGEKGAWTRHAGGAHAIAMCHGKRDEQPIEFHIGILVSRGQTRHLSEPFFDPKRKPFVPRVLKPDGPITFMPPSPHVPTAAEIAQKEYEALFSPLPKPRKRRTLHEQGYRRDVPRELRTAFYARKRNSDH